MSVLAAAARTEGGPKPLLEEPPTRAAIAALWIFVIAPFLTLLAALPVAWGAGLSISDVVLAVGFYIVTGLGVAIGLHRYLTHGSFRARRWLRVTLAVAGTLSVEGPVTQWVADHRRHHAFADRAGDPHSPWRYGGSVLGVAKGLAYAHCGWLFRRERSNRARFAPDLLADRDIRRVDRLFLPLVAVSLLAPAAAGGLLTWSWQGALSALFWAGLVRMALLHHVTWSINSVCHVVGSRPFATRSGDRAANFWPLAIISFGESWHNSHHAVPTCARHGVQRGQLDPAARMIWLFEKAGWISDVRWGKPVRHRARQLTGKVGTVEDDTGGEPS